MPDTQLRVEQEGPVTVASIGTAFRTIDDQALTEVTQFLLELTADPHGKLLVVDLSHTDFFGSAFLGILFRAWNRLTKAGGRFALCSLRPHCQEVIHTARLDTLWDIYDTRAQAVQDLSPPPA